MQNQIYKSIGLNVHNTNCKGYVRAPKGCASKYKFNHVVRPLISICCHRTLVDFLINFINKQISIKNYSIYFATFCFAGEHRFKSNLHLNSFHRFNLQFKLCFVHTEHTKHLSQHLSLPICIRHPNKVCFIMH